MNNEAYIGYDGKKFEDTNKRTKKRIKKLYPD
jgi:hypothetical protein